MIKVFCDFCGKELNNEETQGYELQVYPGIDYAPQDCPDAKDYWMIEHVCDSCVKDLYDDIVKAMDKVVESYLNRGEKK